MFPLVVVACGVLGLITGSFLNVVAYRVPLGRSVVSPPSGCPACGMTLRPSDNIPVLSWLLLRGRCRECRSTISIRYPLVEVITAVMFLLTAVRFGVSWSLPAELVFVGGLVALASVDQERHLLPRAIVYPTLVLVATGLVVAAVATNHWTRIGVAAVCMTGAFAVFFLVNFARPAWLGFGDVRLAALLGLALGWVGPWYLLLGFMAANLLGATVGTAMMISGHATRTTALPYGVFLAAGAFMALLLGAPVIAWYSHVMVR